MTYIHTGGILDLLGRGVVTVFYNGSWAFGHIPFQFSTTLSSYHHHQLFMNWYRMISRCHASASGLSGGWWRNHAAVTSEQGADSAPTQCRCVFFFVSLFPTVVSKDGAAMTTKFYNLIGGTLQAWWYAFLQRYPSCLQSLSVTFSCRPNWLLVFS